ncbi:MAG: SipW-dependent-type signal peptide-containing protein [Oscillospiraceae bacterium]|nr:SipW-dependent-type signal peptide-containing protein [Oscillospiraceae bacterium]
MKKKNIAITAAAVTLAAALVLGGTYAYLTSETNSVKNTFDPNQNSVDINETTEGYDIIPGTSQDKNPTITATYTLDSYVFVEVTDATDDLVTWYIANGWTPLEDPTVNENEDDNVTTTNVYYQLLKYDDTEGETNTATLSVLAGNKVYYSASLTNSDMENADDDISLTFQGYIIQAEPFADAANAWLVVNGEGVAINDDTGVVYTDSVATAIDVAKEGETVRLLTNQTIEATQTYITTSMTLELDGHTLNAYHIMMQGDADLVLQNGTLNCTTGIAQDITNDEVYGTGDLTLTNVELTVSSGYAIQFNTGTITIDSTTSINHTGSNTYVIALFPEKTDDFIMVDCKMKLNT